LLFCIPSIIASTSNSEGPNFFFFAIDVFLLQN
jgi:hypothetical protein